MNLIQPKIWFVQTLVIFFCAPAISQNTATEVAGIPVNYDESRVQAYTLPDPLEMQNGERVKDAETWYGKRRPEILDIFEREQFGRSPDRKHVSFEVFEAGTPVLNEQAIRKQVSVYFTDDTSNYKADLLMYLPARSKRPAPLFLKIGFSPNYLAVDDPGVRCGMMWNREEKQIPASEGRRFGTFDVEKFISNDIGVALIYYGDIEPDFPQGIQYGIRGHYLKSDRNYPAPNEWGAISAWAWGLSCVIDYLETDRQVDAQKVALHGVSRLEE